MPARGVLLGAPHTSNWDFILMVMVSWTIGVKFRFLAKKSVFWEPLGTLMRALGGIPVDRSGMHGLTRELVEMAARGEEFIVVITPEATRSKVAHWKSGFYRIATEAELPIIMGFVDRRSMTCGVGPHFEPTGDLTPDMNRLREYYTGKVGVRPGNEAVPRLAAEGAEPQAGTG